jgi:hypothetical protein
MRVAVTEHMIKVPPRCCLGIATTGGFMMFIGMQAEVAQVASEGGEARRLFVANDSSGALFDGGPLIFA